MIYKHLFSVNILLLLAALQLVSCHAFAQTTTARHNVNITASKFTLYGTTNLNSFECTLVEDHPTGPMAVKTQSSEYDIHFEGLEMKYNINDFDCGLEAMSDDLKHTLKSGDFPYLTLRINDIKIKDEYQEIEKLSVISEVTITLAGVKRDVSILEGYVINHSRESLTLSGLQQLEMKSFNIEPPTKFFGMVKVNNELSVGFEISMEATPMK